MDASIVAAKLTKTYPRTKAPALDQLSLQVKAGEVYGFLGSNGAGKSTTIRLLLNFIQPTGGTARILDMDVVKDSVAVKRHVGYLSGDVALWPKVTGHELFSYLSKLQQKDSSEYLKELVHRFEAEPAKQIDELSKGNRQKIGVIQALMHQPEVLILDEPTSGLDPLMQEAFYKSVREAKVRGAAVFVSSHNLAEAQRMCDRVGIIKHGKLIREQTIKDDASLGLPVYRIVLKHQEDARKIAADSSIKVLSHEGPIVVLQPAGTINQTLKVLANYDIVNFTSQQVDLEEEFLEYYGDGA